MTEDELTALIERNERRKQVKAKANPAPWFKQSCLNDDGMLTHVISLDEEFDHDNDYGWGRNICRDLCGNDADFITYAHKDTPGDDIDQLLAWIADLETALAEK